jgi:hypothetical protein
MAESATELPLNIEETVRETVQNATEKAPSTIEGVAIAYLSLVIMAILPIFFGSFRSVKYLKEQKVSLALFFFNLRLILNHNVVYMLSPMRRGHVLASWHNSLVYARNA